VSSNTGTWFDCQITACQLPCLLLRSSEVDLIDGLMKQVSINR
jgi:hypothetical protein